MWYSRPNIKAYYLFQAFSRLIRECDADDELSIKELLCLFSIKVTISMFPVSLVFNIRGDTGTHPSLVMSHLCVV
jgi:hypothetical protein